jgi:hypothetical protein
MSEHLIYICEICQTVLDEHHCKAVCPNCGRMFDCSDLPLIAANALIDNDDNVVTRPGTDLSDMLPQHDENADPAPAPAPARRPKPKDGGVANLP